MEAVHNSFFCNILALGDKGGGLTIVRKATAFADE
jgi:hypothetical protein